MTEEIRLHPCPLDECGVTIEGVRDQPNAEVGQRIAQVLGVHTAFYGDQWLFNESQRIEDELRKHLETHDLVEYVTEIVRLRKALMAKTSQLEMANSRQCQRLCCQGRM